MPAAAPKIAEAAVDEMGCSTAIVLALLGQDAMRRLRDVLTDHDLKPRQFQILDVLVKGGPIGQRDLGDAIAIDHSILVTMLNPLEADGLIERRRDTVDRRRHVVTVTAAGKRRLTSAARAQGQAEDELFAALTVEQRAQLHSLLTEVRDANNTGPVEADCE